MTLTDSALKAYSPTLFWKKRAEERPFKAGRGGIRPDSITYARGGSVCVVRRPGSIMGKKPPDRGLIWQFTRQARKRMQHRIAEFDCRAMPASGVWFITLTYPKVYPTEFETWKKHLAAWRKRFERKYGKHTVTWKIEPQRRGAPHFHLMVFFGSGMCAGIKRQRRGRKFRWIGESLDSMRKWCSQVWYDIVESGDEKHLVAGTQVAIAGHAKATAKYAAKYIGKECQFVDQETGEILRAGRFWGIWNMSLTPREIRSTICTWAGQAKIGRQMRRYLQSKNPNIRWYRKSNPTKIFFIPWKIICQILGFPDYRSYFLTEPNLMDVSREIYGTAQEIFMPGRGT